MVPLEETTNWMQDPSFPAEQQARDGFAEKELISSGLELRLLRSDGQPVLFGDNRARVEKPGMWSIEV